MRVNADLEKKILAQAVQSNGEPVKSRHGKSITIICALCGKDCIRTGTVQRYCSDCSAKRDLERKRLWLREHPETDPEKIAKRNAGNAGRTAKAVARGAEQSIANASSIAWDAESGRYLAWFVRFSVPFSYAASKNHIYTMRRDGHVSLREQSREFRRMLNLRTVQALEGRTVAHNKVWLEILVQKPDHKGDAVNLVDTVCDAMKAAIGIDDRWFCIRKLDWEICKVNPRLYIGIGQESLEDCQVCSYCGAIKPLRFFGKKKNGKMGHTRECRQCVTGEPDAHSPDHAEIPDADSRPE